MKIEQRAWAKTLLSCYAYLGNICETIDKKVISYGIGSASHRDTEFVANKIINLIERKKFLINTKILVDRVLVNLDLNLAKVLVLKFVDKTKVEVAAETMNMSLRTYFRKVDISVDKFASILLGYGYDSKRLYDTYKDENWILEIYKSFLNKHFTEAEKEHNDENQSISNTKIKNIDSLNTKNNLGFLGIKVKSFSPIESF